MKRVLGLCILVILFLALGGCMQPAPSVPTTTAAPTTAVPATPAPVGTTVAPNETTVAPAATTAAEVTTVAENVTPAINETAVNETVAPAVPSAAPTTVVTANYIHMQNNTFVPSATTVLPGTGIVWVNDDKVVHTVKATGAFEGMFNSGDIAPGARWDYTFGANTGSYTYTDPNYPGMNGTIIIQKGRTLTSSY